MRNCGNWCVESKQWYIWSRSCGGVTDLAFGWLWRGPREFTDILSCIFLLMYLHATISKKSVLPWPTLRQWHSFITFRFISRVSFGIQILPAALNSPSTLRAAPTTSLVRCPLCFSQPSAGLQILFKVGIRRQWRALKLLQTAWTEPYNFKHFGK